MTLECTRSQIQLDEIAEVKHELLIPQRMVFIGYNTESLRRNELIYEVHDVTSGKKSSSGRLPIFGISFLTGYTRYKGNTFINLIGMSGRKIIELNDFEHNLRSQLVKTIEYKDYQLKPVREKYGLFYSGEAIMLVEVTETPPLVNVLVRSYTESSSNQLFRIISFDPIPKFFFNGHELLLTNQSQLTCISQKLQPNYTEIINWQNIRVVAIHEQLIIAFGDSNSDYFLMSFAGKVVELAQSVKGMAIWGRFIAVVTQNSQFEKRLKVIEYLKNEHKYREFGSMVLPIECRNALLFEEWIKVDVDNSTENNRYFLKVDLVEAQEHKLSSHHERHHSEGKNRLLKVGEAAYEHNR